MTLVAADSHKKKKGGEKKNQDDDRLGGRFPHGKPRGGKIDKRDCWTKPDALNQRCRSCMWNSLRAKEERSPWQGGESRK